MIVACITNIILDLLFVMVFRWGIAGAAIATVTAQGVSFLFSFRILRRLPQLALKKEDFILRAPLVKELLILASPMAFQNFIIAAGGLVVQYVVNGFGFLFVAGYTATNKLYGLLEIAATSFGFSMATYTGQNLGGGKPERIREGMRKGLVMAISIAAAIALSGKILSDALHLRNPGGNGAGPEILLYVFNVYGRRPSGTLYAIYVPFRSAGNGRYGSSDAFRRRGAGHENLRGFDPAVFCGGIRRLYRGSCCLDGSRHSPWHHVLCAVGTAAEGIGPS